MIQGDIDQQKVVEAVTVFWRDRKDERVQKEADLKECWLAYIGKFGKSWANVAQYRSHRYIPVSTQAVDAVSSHLAQGVMPHDDWFKAIGRTPDDMRPARAMTSLMKWQHFKSGWRSAIAKAVKQAAIFGTVPWGVFWTEDLSLVPDMEGYAAQLGAYALEGSQDPELPRPAIPAKIRRNYDGPIFQTHNIFDTVFDRRPDDPDRGLVVLKMVKSKAYVKALSEPDPITGYRTYEDPSDLNAGDQEVESSDSIRREVDAALGFFDIPKDGIELLSAWGDFEIDGQIFPNHVAVVANRTKLMRFEPNPFWHGKRPWNIFCFSEDPLELMGKGILEGNLGIQDWINVRMNQIIEANALIVNPMFEVVDDGTFDLENWISAPGAVHLVSQPNTIRPIVTPDTTEPGMREVGFAMGQFNEFTGAMKAFTTQDYQKSATEVNAIAGMVNSRFAELVKHFESKLIVPALEMQIQLNQQMQDEDVWLRVTQSGMDPVTGIPYDSDQPTMMKVSPDDVQGEFDIYPVGASWVAKTQQGIQMAMNLTQTLAQSPVGGQLKWRSIAKSLYRDCGYQDAQDFVMSDGEVAYAEQQAFMAQQYQQQMGGPEGPGEGGGPAPAGQQPGNRGVQSRPGSQGPPPGGGAGTGSMVQTAGGPQRGSG